VAALQGVIWVLVLTIVSLYAAGILATRLIGQRLMIPHGIEVDDEILMPFSNVPESMFTLFRVMSGAASDKEAFSIDELMKEVPSVKFAFVFFMVTSSWTLLSILTAVVSENMISTTQQQYEDLKLSLFEEDRLMQAKELAVLFSELDSSGDGCVDAGEVENAMQDEEFAQRTAVLLKMPKRDILEVLHMMIQQEENPSGVEMGRFVECLIDSSCPVTERSIMKVESRLVSLFQCLQRLEDIVTTGSSATPSPEAPKVGMRISMLANDILSPQRKSMADPSENLARRNSWGSGGSDGFGDDAHSRGSKGSEGSNPSKRNSRGSGDGGLPARNSRGSEDGSLPKRSSKGSQAGDLPKRNSRGSEDRSLPKRSSKGSQDGDLQNRAGAEGELVAMDDTGGVAGDNNSQQSVLSPYSMSKVAQGCAAEVETDSTAATVTSDGMAFNKSVDQLVRRFGELERRHREDVENLCSKLDSKLPSKKEGQGALSVENDFLMAAQQLQDVLVDRFNELERRHQDYFRTLFGKFEDFQAREPENRHHQLLGCPMSPDRTDGLNQARDIVDFFADMPVVDDGELTVQHAGSRATRARKKMKDMFCCSRV